MKNPNHPVWALARLAILMATLSFVLWLTASKFDETELRTICWVFVAAASVEGVGHAVGNWTGKGDGE